MAVVTATTLTNGGCVGLVSGGAGEYRGERDVGCVAVAVDDRLLFHYNRQCNVTTTTTSATTKHKRIVELPTLKTIHFC